MSTGFETLLPFCFLGLKSGIGRLKAPTKEAVRQLESLFGMAEVIGKGNIMKFGEGIVACVRFSAIHKGGDGFYGIEREFLDHQSPQGSSTKVFGAFVFGGSDHIFFVPRDVFKNSLIAAKSNRFHIKRIGDRFYLRTAGQDPINITSYLNNFPISSMVKPVQEEDKESPIDESTVRLHTQIQYFLLKFGLAAGYRVWVAPQDRQNRFDNEKLGDLGIKDLPSYGLNELAHRIVQNIDVIWLDKDSIIRAFEIETTSAIYSGLLRMSDLIYAQSNILIGLSIVSPRQRREKVKEQILRPTFRNLRERCTYLSCEEIISKYDIAKQVLANQWELRVQLEGEKF